MGLNSKKIVCPYSSRVIVGVSGGVDSMTLADMLHRQGCVDFAVAHCNFHLRGEDSDGDAEFVLDWCEKRGVKFHHIDFDTLGYARSRKASIEMAARELRYGWFAKLCKEYGYEAVAIAHNANDNAETLLLNLVRGTGLRGICGMQTASVQNVEAGEELAAALGCMVADFPETLNIWRPLLGMTRDQIEGYAHKQGLSWREDRTNRDTEYKRNLIRNEVIPLLERLNPSVVKTLNRNMRHFSEAQAIVGDYFSGGGPACTGGLFDWDFPSAVSGQGDDCSPDAALLDKIVSRSKGWRYALFLYLERYSFNSSVIGQVEDLLESDRTVSGKIFYSPTHSLVMTSTSLIVSPLRLPATNSDFSGVNSGSENGCAPFCHPKAGVSLKGIGYKELAVIAPGEYHFSGNLVKVELLDRPANFNPRQPLGVTVVDADKVRFPLKLRTWQDGDWMRPLGCHGRKKVSDLFTDLKFSLPQKRSAIFIESKADESETSSHPSRIPQPVPTEKSSRHVLALLGHRIDDSVRVTPQTCSILRFTITPNLR
mgnify:FL=1